MQRLKKIVDSILKQSKGAQGRLLLARVGLISGINLILVTDKTPNNPEIENKILHSYRQITGNDLEVNFDDEGMRGN